MPQSDAPAGMVKLAHVLVEAPYLRSWFYSLEHLSRSLRHTAFGQMAAQMRSAGEEPDLTSAVAMLAQPRMYERVLAAVRERVDETSRPT